ncbi:beta strand repeat-containing protein [Novosphingobium sp. Leaf2]|uniref:beta strand repeat-containing protein n=1 Tax=Novosphingobium sp. Leaf2 TaxID=1735670 RepID=UPI0007020B80|nr:autotransporter outer membrane beta-barrel domain-containing protein [Novosphingobium sp. Leaf2]KQM21521.1 autotransporter [Novosphingobium sp. Leaf2]
MAAALAVPAYAQDACGAPVDGTVTCTPASNPYPNGIQYYSPAADPARDPGLDPTAPVLDLTVVLQPGVQVAPTSNVPGVALIGFNDGAVTLNAADNTAIAVSGTGSIGVLGLTNYGDLTINTDSIVANGRASTGINANSNEGAITINANTIAVTGNSGVGISANSYRGDVTIDAGTVSASGYYVGGINAYTGSGNIAITADRVSTTGGSFYNYGSTAIEARSAYGSIAMDLGTVSTEADYSNGITAVSFGTDGVVDIHADTITTAGFASIGVLMQGATANLSVDNLSTSGDGAYGAVMFGTGPGGVNFTSIGTVSTTGEDAMGVFAKAYGGGSTVINVANVTTQGDNSTAVYGYSQSGDVAITVNNASTVGNNSPAVHAVGVNAAVTVTGAVSTQGVKSDGVIALGFGGNADVVNTGSISTSGGGSRGIYAGAIYDVSVSGTGSVQTSGYEATGIEAVSLYGGINIAAGSVTTTGDYARGIHAYAMSPNGGSDVSVNVRSVSTKGVLSDGIGALSLTGNVNVTSTGTISTAGEGAFGAYAFSLLGDAAITVNNVTTTGNDAVGVQAYGYNASVTVNGALSTSGTDGAFGFSADGVQATGSFGTATVTVNGSVKTSGDYATGVFARGYYGATVTNSGTITTSGDFANGVKAQAAYGPAVVVNNGTIATSGEGSAGIVVEGYSDVAVRGTGSVKTTGNYAAGIAASTIYGTASVAMGSVTTTGAVATAINAYGALGTTVNVETVSTQGVDSIGVLAGSYGDVSVTAGSVSTAGNNSDAIRAATFGAGSTITINAGKLSTTGTNSNAITALGFGGDVNVNLTGAVSAAQDTAVVIQSAGNVGVTVGTAGSVTGAINGIESDAVGTTTITNRGTINTGSGYAIVVAGGPAVVANAGTLNGRVLLSSGNDRFTNTGLFHASASSDFGAGNDVFTNTGTVLVDGPGTAPLNVTFTGLETFANSGLLDLRNGTVGDQLTLPGTFTGSGASTLGLDIASTAAGVMTADRLNVGTAAGSTQIQLGVTGNVFVTPGVTVVQASAASSATAFTISPASANVGLVALDVVYRPTTFAYQLVGTPGAGAYRAAKVLEGAQSLWYRSADAVTAHLTSVRDGSFSNGANAGGFWLQMSGGVDKRDDARAASQFGISRSYDLGYRQDYFGGQIGFDVGTMGENGGVVFGVTAGYLSSALRFEEATRFQYDVANVGAYASLRAGGFFANGLVKYDHFWIDANGGSAGYKDRLGGDAIGAQVEAGFRLGSGGFFAEPVASVAYVRTSLDDLQALGQVLDYDRADGLRGKAGVRIGGTIAIGGGNMLTFYASGMAVKEFKGRDGATFVSGPYALALGNRRIGTYGQGTLGINVTTPGGINGFIEGTLDASGNYSGAGGRAGIKIPF